jgi:hypothetical protein
MTPNIKLTRFVPNQEQLPPALQTSWPVSILAQGVGMDDSIFVYQVGKTDDPIAGDKFQCVASVNQMYELPKNQGVSLTIETGIPYYRSNVLQFVSRSAEEAQRIWLDVIQEVELLVLNLNAATSMQATDFAQIDGSGSTLSSITSMNPPVQIQITSLPAGLVAVQSGVQVITTPDSNLMGWLPVSALSLSVTRPANAAFFYNLALDPNLNNVWPPLYPLEGNALHRNGIAMPYGIVWSLTLDTIWWLKFDPTTIPGYQRSAPGASDGNAPWALDFVDLAHPGAMPNILTLTLFK